MSDNNRSLHRTLLVSSLLLTFSLAGIYLFQPKSLEILNLKATDIILASAKAPEPKLDIVTVAIDDASVNKYGQWPWPRHRLARLLAKISASEAKSIGVNIIFAERDRTSLKLLQKTLTDDFGYSIDTSGIPSEILDHDTYLANILTMGPYVLGYTFLFDNTATDPQPPTFRPVSLAYNGGEISQPPTTRFYQASGFIGNYEILANAVPNSGFLNGMPDIDGVLRRLPLVIEYNGKVYPSFPLAMLMQFRRHDVLLTNSDMSGINHFSLADFNIPTDEKGNFLLGSSRVEKSKQFCSAAEVLEGTISPDFFKDKLVLVGLTAAGLVQEYPTPLAPAISLLDLHRYCIDSLTSDLHTIRTSLFPVWEIAISFLFCLVLVYCVFHLSTILASLSGLMTASFCWFAAATIYQSSGYLFSPLLPTISVILSSCLLLVLKFHYFQQRTRTATGDTVLLLKSNENNLHSILNTIPDIVFRLDTDGNITFISPAISKYQKSPEPLLGHHIFELVAPEDLKRARYRLNERRTGDRATYDLEIRLLLGKTTSDQQDIIRHFSLSAEGIYRPNRLGPKRFIGTQGIFRDITKRKQLESQLLEAQKMEVIGNLAAGIAHDLNNILSGLVSYPDLLLLEIPQHDPLYQKIQVIQRSGKKAAVIVQDLLTLARRGMAIDEIYNINTIISEYLESIEFQTIQERHPNTHVITDLPDNIFLVKGSSIHLSKVIMNILSNGLEAMPGGGDIIISTTNVYIDTDFEGYETIPEGEYVCISVSDNGVGIPVDDLKRIFEPFYTKKSLNLSGTGLGMTIVWATIKDHNGYIDIQSEEGRGTTFQFYLPTTREDVRARQGRIVLDDYLGSETILIVDDIPEQLDIAQNMLSKLGYTVHTAGSGEKALEYIKQHPVDLVILDMIMPGGLDGLETYQEMIQLFPNQKAIISSGFIESERVKKLLHLGAGDYVQKPYTLEKLGMAVRGELDRKKDQ